MRRAPYALGFALVVAASLYLLPALRAADEPVPDSPEVTELLTQAKTHAIRLTDDSDMMYRYSLSGLSWRSHANAINGIKEHINSMGKLLKQMGEKRESASPWQQSAIDRVTPLAAELAANVEKTIEHINENQIRLHTIQYREYLHANYEVATSLSGLIGDYVAYGKNKANYERFGSELEVPGH